MKPSFYYLIHLFFYFFFCVFVHCSDTFRQPEIYVLILFDLRLFAQAPPLALLSNTKKLLPIFTVCLLLKGKVP
jgi:hypothetical protein